MKDFFVASLTIFIVAFFIGAGLASGVRIIYG